MPHHQRQFPLRAGRNLVLGVHVINVEHLAGGRAKGVGVGGSQVPGAVITLPPAYTLPIRSSTIGPLPPFP